MSRVTDNNTEVLRGYTKALKEQLDHVTAERDGVRDQLASRTLDDALSGFKNPRRVERNLRADGINPLDSSAVEAWLADNSDDYA